jgi:GDP-L-fucose synthase
MFKLLVTGANGLLGSHISADVKLTRNDCDLLNFDETKKIFQEIQPTHVIHTAALVGGIVGNLNHMAWFFQDNMRMSLNVLEACRLAGVTKVISALSTCIYSTEIEQPHKECDIHNAPPFESHFAYAYAKRMIDIQNRAYEKQYNLKYTGAVLPNLYGPGDNFDLVNGHLTPSLLLKAYEAKLYNKPLIVWGTGIARRELVYIEDVANILQNLIHNYDEVEPINISPGVDYSLSDIVNAIVKILDHDIEIIYDTTKPDGQLTKRTDNTKMNKYLPNFKFTPLEIGLTKTIKWIESNYPNLRGL